MASHSSLRVAETGGNPFLRLVAFLSTLCGFAASGMIVAAVGITCQMIWVRFVLNLSTIWQTEAVIYLMVGATLLGLPYVQHLRGHVNVDLIPLILPQMVRKLLAIITLVATIIVMVVMFIYGFELWHVAWQRGWTSDTVWGLSLWIPYLAMPIGFGLFLLQLVADLFAVIMNIDVPFGLEKKDQI